jgi:hypothetical protein
VPDPKRHSPVANVVNGRLVCECGEPVRPSGVRHHSISMPPNFKGTVFIEYECPGCLRTGDYFGPLKNWRDGLLREADLNN